MKRLLAILCVLAMVLTLVPMAVFAAEPESVDFVVLSTTDMHGKCWDTNVLTDGTENNNMLRVATAVKGYRESYGDNVLVIDNGDTYQGTPVSVVQLNKFATGESELPPAMALCLAEIGYDVSVVGNHEFNYLWSTMSRIYSYLEGRGVPVVTANLYYDGTDGVHEKGENVFTPYITKTVTIGGKEHKIGILGFENTDCTRWDIPDNYPGIVFAHPDNTSLSMAWEAQRYIPKMQAEGCEFIIVSYHSGTGSTSGDLVFGTNTEGQVSRMIAECEGIDMVVAGHDHSSGYSNTYLKDKNGKDVLVVNGGGQQLTQSIFTFTENVDGKLEYSVKESKNLSLGSYTSDAALKEMLQPYADMAVEYVNQTAGTAVGTWDNVTNYYLKQSNTIDLINGAQIDYGTKYLAKKYDTPEKLAALYEATGLDHLEVDLSSTSVVTNNNYYVKPGPISMKTIVQMYKYDNNVLYILPLTGQQIKDILEQNASTRLKATVKNGNVSYSTIGDSFTNPVFGGLNFVYDMYQPEGSRVVIDGFSNGRAFELDKTYIVACNSYHLGNVGCGFGNYTTTDSIWNQNDDLAGGNVQEVLFEYIADKGEISADMYNWTWELTYSGDPTVETGLKGDHVAKKADGVHDGDEIVIYYDAESTVIGKAPAENDARLSAVDTTSYQDYIAFADTAAVFTVEMTEGEHFLLHNEEKGYLNTAEGGNSLGFTDEPTACSEWYLTAVEGGFHIMNVGAHYGESYNQAIEWFTGFTTYGVKDSAIYLFNIYQLVDTYKRAEALEDGKQYAIYYDAEELTVADTANDGGLGTVKNAVSGAFMMPPLAEHTLVVTANMDDEGRIDFTTEDGKHMTAPPTGSGLSLTDELAANDCSLWTLVAVNGGWHVMNVGAAYNGNHNQALEYYGGKVTTYGVKDSEIYLYNFYEIAAAEEEPEEPAKELEGKTVILHTNDTHGAIMGFANVAALKAEYEAKGATVILMDAGDYSQGTTYVSTNKGAAAVTMLNAAGYDYVTLGNHEFDFGYAQLMSNMEAAEFQVLVADVLLKETGKPIFDGHAIIEADGLKIGVFGMETPETFTKVNPGLIQEITFPQGEEMYACAQAEVDALKEEGADLIIGLVHLGVDSSSDPNRSIDLYNHVEGIDFLIDGHSHTVMTEGPNGEPIQSTGTKANTTAFMNVGYILIDNETGEIVENKLLPVTEETPIDETVAAVAQEIMDKVNAEYGAVFATSEVELTGVAAPGNRTEETNLGDLITDSMLWGVLKEGELEVATENVVAITNGGGIRAPIHKGDVTKNDVNTVLPFGNTVAVVYVKGAELLEALEASTFCTPTSIGGFPQVSGMKFTINTAKEFDQGEQYPESTYYGPASIQRVTIDEINGKAFDPEATYAVVTNNFCAAGGDTYYAFKAATAQFDTGLPLDEVLIDYIQNKLDGVIGEEYAAPKGRITITDKVDEPTIENPFEDVAEGEYYYDAVLWAVDNGITTGTTPTTFRPDNLCTRAQIVTFLWRAYGEPKAEKAENPFADVKEGEYYYDAVLWAAEKGITKGTSDNRFGVDDTCTRAQAVTFLHRAAGEPEAETAENKFEDVKDTDYYYNAVLWAVENGITTGTTDTTFRPEKSCTRAEIVTFLYRALAEK